MSSSVTMKALHRGWAVLSHTPGFFSTAADSWPVMGAALVCRALAIADRRVLSVQPGPTPEEHNQQGNYEKEKQRIHSIFIDYVGHFSVKHPEGLSAAPLFSPVPQRCHRHLDRWASSPKIAAKEKNKKIYIHLLVSRALSKMELCAAGLQTESPFCS